MCFSFSLVARDPLFHIVCYRTYHPDRICLAAGPSRESEHFATETRRAAPIGLAHIMLFSPSCDSKAVENTSGVVTFVLRQQGVPFRIIHFSRIATDSVA